MGVGGRGGGSEGCKVEFFQSLRRNLIYCYAINVGFVGNFITMRPCGTRFYVSESQILPRAVALFRPFYETRLSFF